FECPDPLPVFADPRKMEIILFNLLSNAFKHTPDGGRISFSVTESELEILVSVTDTGRGIAPEVGDRLFEKYYQAGDGSSRQGFGIGLYLVRRLMVDHRALKGAAYAGKFLLLAVRLANPTTYPLNVPLSSTIVVIDVNKMPAP
ncbi:MAG: sensor histidine kinase, partial [bacterium]